MSRIAAACPASPAPRRRWHKLFLAMLPQIITHARIAFRHVRGQDRQDKIQEVVANALVAFHRLVQLKKAHLAYPTVLARYAVAQIKDGRLVGGHMNVKDASSPYCQRVKGVIMERLDHYDDVEGAWKEVVVEDKTAGPADIARTRIDFSDWLDTLGRRNRKIALKLAEGEKTTRGRQAVQGLGGPRQSASPRPWPRTGGSSSATRKAPRPYPRSRADPHPAYSGPQGVSTRDEDPYRYFAGGKITTFALRWATPIPGYENAGN